MQTRNIRIYNDNKTLKFQCPKCNSTNIHQVREKVNHYYSREDTYIRNDMYLCADCLYMDFYTQFKEIRLKGE